MKKTEKKKATPAATPKTKQPWATDSKTIFPKDSVDLAMVQITERVLQSPTDNKSEDDEDSLFGRIFAKSMKKLAPKTKGFVRLQIEQLLFQSEFGTGTTHNPLEWVSILLIIHTSTNTHSRRIIKLVTRHLVVSYTSIHNLWTVGMP